MDLGIPMGKTNSSRSMAVAAAISLLHVHRGPRGTSLKYRANRRELRHSRQLQPIALRAAKNVIGGTYERTNSDELEAASMEVVPDMTFVPVHQGHRAGVRRRVCDSWSLRASCRK